MLIQLNVLNILLFKFFFSVSSTQEIRRPKQFDDDAEGGSDDDGSDEAADQVFEINQFSNFSQNKVKFFNVFKTDDELQLISF